MQTQTTSEESPRPASAFGFAFWALNTIEMFERLAFYTLRVMAPIYIMQADDPGGLHLTPQDKGVIYAWWAVFQSILPMATGGFADRYGYKRTMAFAITMMMIGYLMVALWRDVLWLPARMAADGAVLVTAQDRSNYWSLFISIMTLATGTAFFKPSIQGSLAQNLTKANSSVGWGIFYWVVNVGAFVGHYIPGLVFLIIGSHSREAWRNLFLLSAGFTALNYVVMATYRDVPTGASKTDSMWAVLVKTFANILEARLIAWLLIMSGFWMMMYQLWDLQPNFIADWVDSGPIATALESFLGVGETLRSVAGNPDVLNQIGTVERMRYKLFAALTEQTARGVQIPQQVLLSLNAFCIIVGVIGVSWLTRKMRTLTAMLGGMLLATAGVLVAGLTMSPWVLLLGIVFFSLGEMTTGPKKNEYLGLIAPPGKKELYLGYVNIPVGVGVFAGSWIAGEVYGRFGEKAILALRYLAEKTQLAAGKAWDGETKSLEALLEVKRSDAMARLQEVTGLDSVAATKILWDTYNPQFKVWIPFAVIGIISAIALAVFGQMAKRWKDMNA